MLFRSTGQNVTAQLGKEAFQCVDIATIAAPVSKKTWCITQASQVPFIMQEAFHTARAGRPGPVLLDLPLDVQMADIPFDPDAYQPLPVHRPAPDAAAIEKALDLLLAAEKPVLIMGGGVLLADAQDLFVQFAEYLSLPVITTYMATGGIAAGHQIRRAHV